MATSKYIPYKDKLKDPRWQKKRLEVLSENNFTCQYCGDTETTLHVHHLCYNSETYNPWDVDNTALLCICENCHTIEHLQGLSEFDKELIKAVKDMAVIYSGRDWPVNQFVQTVVKKIITKYKVNGKN